MSNLKRPFTCYFCNELIENGNEIGHTSLCSKVLITCPYKCGAYIQRANLHKHKAECINQMKRSISVHNLKAASQGANTNSLDRNERPSPSKTQIQEDISKLYRRFSELESRLRISENREYPKTPNASVNIKEIKDSLKQHTIAIEKINYYNGFMLEWKKTISHQVTSLKSTLSSMESVNKESLKRWSYVQESILHLQNLQIDLKLLKESVYKDSTHFKKTEMDFARNIEELRNIINDQSGTLANTWTQHARALDDVVNKLERTKQALDEQKAKHVGLIFDLRAVSHISSEAAERVEIQERDFKEMRQEVNQIKSDLEILENLASSSDSASSCYKRMLWRITDVESKMKKAKENDIVLKSPIFYTNQYGYKIRVLLYLNGLKKWRERYALACIHVLKGEYDMLLTWPCNIEGTIMLRDLDNLAKPKNISKYIKTKRSCGDEDEDEPQESSSTYIFIPHNVLLKDTYLKHDTIYLDIEIKEKHETSL